jgi:hypothetical protein
MGFCKCKDVAWFETMFGLFVFVFILFAMKERAFLVFEQIELYRAVVVVLGVIVAAGVVGIVSSLSVLWIIENIGKVLIVSVILWMARLSII